jgi:hypothetical protein
MLGRREGRIRNHVFLELPSATNSLDLYQSLQQHEASEMADKNACRNLEESMSTTVEEEGKRSREAPQAFLPSFVDGRRLIALPTR